MANKKVDQVAESSPESEARTVKVADIAERYPQMFIECRDFGHSWRPKNASWLQGGSIERTLGCSRCKTTRTQILDREGYIVSGYYEYADGYRLVGLGALKAPDRAEFRRSSVTRYLNKP